jgi:hypothetical protein
VEYYELKQPWLSISNQTTQGNQKSKRRKKDP